MTTAPYCDFCGEGAVLKHDDGTPLCEFCATLYKRPAKHQRSLFECEENRTDD